MNYKPHLCKFCGETNPDKFSARRKSKCKDCKATYDKQYYQDNKDSMLAQRASYREANKELLATQWKIYYAQNGLQINLKARNRYKKTKEVRQSKQKLYRSKSKAKINAVQNRRRKSSAFRFVENLRSRQRLVLRGVVSTTKGLGCTSKELVEYIMSQFTTGMTLNNYGNQEGCWSLDHVLPISSYEKDLEGNWCIKSTYNKKLIHYTNLQPMWHIDNILKSNKII